MHKLESLFGPQGPLKKILPNYQPRWGQMAMAETVLRALNSGHHLIVEAPTGTGKTFAYLIPAITARKRVIVSTAGITLMNQLVNKDLPLLKEAGFRFTYAALKGRQNYYCHKKGAEVDLRFLAPMHNVDGDAILEWIHETKTGDIDDCPEVPRKLWNFINADSISCQGKQCHYYSDCFLYRAREKASKADIVVTNHHLLLSDLYIKGGILPENVDAIIIDEAHELEGTAMDVLRLDLSYFKIKNFFERFERDLRNEAMACELSDDVVRNMLDLASKIETMCNHLFLGTITPDELPDEGKRVELSSLEKASILYEAIARLYLSFESLVSKIKRSGIPFEAALPWLRFCEEVKRLCEIVINDDKEYVQYIDTFYVKGKKHFALVVSPIEVAHHLQKHLFKRCPVILTSATLFVRNKPDFFAQRIGLDTLPYKHFKAPYVFNYRKQARLYIPETFPEPRSPSYKQAVAEFTTELLFYTGGHALFLSTSYDMVSFVAESLRKTDPPFQILVQGETPRNKLIESFREDPSSVLIATTSFWQGIDVPGDALKVLIIDKIPFDVPDDPVIKAHIEKMKRERRNPFMEYQIPQAIITLRQGIGRLIRSVDDRGIVVIMDSRILNKSYGKNFQYALSFIPRARDFGELLDFYHRSCRPFSRYIVENSKNKEAIPMFFEK